MGVEYIEGGFKLKFGRRRTQVTTYENMPLQTTQPVKKDKQKEIKRNIPSDYANFNYHNRMKKGGRKSAKSAGITLTCPMLSC